MDINEINNVNEKYMKMAIEEAKKGMGYTSPNPMVGCVIVKDGKVLEKACHERYGEYHAERNALLRCKEDVKDATLYVTLEPCCHTGKTPPCTDIIIEKGIKKVYVGCLDVNPLVAGKGIQKLKDNGIEVVSGILEKECEELNEIFNFYIKNKFPFVAVKYAMTLDGKIATKINDSKWITNGKSRNYVHGLRKKYSAILVGINTVLSDDPMLNCRIEENVDPVRIILDSNLRIPVDSNIVKTAKDIKTYVVMEKSVEKLYNDKIECLEKAGINIMKCAEKNGHIDLEELLKNLGEIKIDSVLVEGGSNVIKSFLDNGFVNRIYAFIAPKLTIGDDGIGPVAGCGIKDMKDSLVLKDVEMKRFDDDIMITGGLNVYRDN